MASRHADRGVSRRVVKTHTSARKLAGHAAKREGTAGLVLRRPSGLRDAQRAPCNGSVGTFLRRHVHDRVAEPEEVLARKRLGEEVGHVSMRAHEGDHYTLLLY